MPLLEVMHEEAQREAEREALKSSGPGHSDLSPKGQTQLAGELQARRLAGAPVVNLDEERLRRAR
jgi:hypothetical protein